MPSTIGWLSSTKRVIAHHHGGNVKVGDIDVARIGLGTNRLTITKENVAFIRSAVAEGVQMIDTAHLYTGGQSEQTIGEALSPPPEGCIVATKGGFGGAGRARPEVLHAELEQSIRHLKTDTIYLYYLHRVDPETPIEESLSAIKDYRDRGKVRHVGISNVGIEQIERARRVVPIVAVQNHYNLSERKSEAVVDYCAAEGIAWLLRRSTAVLPIPGTLSLVHLKENLAALQIELTDAEFEALR
ncbi:MAG: aldo/keto reductase [Chloroflexi bacterium]|nr:MAG: aldo/keto reductase [Chloroflexota bacterium]